MGTQKAMFQKVATRPISLCTVTGKVRKKVEQELYELPFLCEELERAEGLDALLISHRIGRIKAALEIVSQDPYYSLIPARYFQGAKERTSAALCTCDKATVWRNRNRLLDVMALHLFGVAAWN